MIYALFNTLMFILTTPITIASLTSLVKSIYGFILGLIQFILCLTVFMVIACGLAWFDSLGPTSHALLMCIFMPLQLMFGGV